MNCQSQNLVSQGFVYSCQHPVIDDLLQSFPVAEEPALNCSKQTQPNSFIETQPGSLVMVQASAYELPPGNSSLKATRSAKPKSAIEVKTFCASDMDTFFVEAPIVNNVTHSSKQIGVIEDGYCDVQSQPMQLTLDTSSRPTNCAKATGKKPPHKITVADAAEKSCNYAMFDSWFQTDQVSSINNHDMYEQPQTQPLQLTQTSSELPKNVSSVAKRTRRRNMPADVVEKTVKCTICGSVLSSSKHLKEHLRIHTGERPFSCGECGYSVSKKSNLRAHQRVHSGEKPYMCGICCKVFSQSAHLTSHMLTHTGEKPFGCSHCEKFFSSKSNMDQHINKQHSGILKHSCEVCGEKFSCQSWLQVHLRVHSQKRPYQCDVCKKRFKDKCYVAKHKRKFCGNDGYANRWKKPGVKKPPGRKRKYKPIDQDGLPKRQRGRPRVTHKKRKKLSRKKRLLLSDIEEDTDSQYTEAAAFDQNVPLALNTNSINISMQNESSNKRHVDDNKLEETFHDCAIENFNSTSSRQLISENCDESSILELDLSAETILDFTKQDSQALQQCFAEPQNLSSSSSSFKNGSGGSMTINNCHFNSTPSDINIYAQPQNLCIPQNLSIHQQMPHSIESVEPKNLSHPQKLQSNPLWDLSNIQPEDLAEPQNLSLTIEPQNLSLQHTLTQPQNLSLGQTLQQPQNLSQTGNVSHNMHHSHINPHVHSLSHVHNLSSGIINTSNSLPHPHSFSHSQDFTQPQNLTVDQSSLNSGQSSYHIQSQPQNLVLPQNLSFTHMM